MATICIVACWHFVFFFSPYSNFIDLELLAELKWEDSLFQYVLNVVDDSSIHFYPSISWSEICLKNPIVNFLVALKLQMQLHYMNFFFPSLLAFPVGLKAVAKWTNTVLLAM